MLPPESNRLLMLTGRSITTFIKEFMKMIVEQLGGSCRYILLHNMRKNCNMLSFMLVVPFSHSKKGE